MLLKHLCIRWILNTISAANILRKGRLPRRPCTNCFFTLKSRKSSLGPSVLARNDTCHIFAEEQWKFSVVKKFYFGIRFVKNQTGARSRETRPARHGHNNKQLIAQEIETRDSLKIKVDMTDRWWRIVIIVKTKCNTLQQNKNIMMNTGPVFTLHFCVPRDTKLKTRIEMKQKRALEN